MEARKDLADSIDVTPWISLAREKVGELVIYRHKNPKAFLLAMSYHRQLSAALSDEVAEIKAAAEKEQLAELIEKYGLPEGYVKLKPGESVILEQVRKSPRGETITIIETASGDISTSINPEASEEVDKK